MTCGLRDFKREVSLNPMSQKPCQRREGCPWGTAGFQPSCRGGSNRLAAELGELTGPAQVSGGLGQGQEDEEGKKREEVDLWGQWE